jgi:hypothetical protein
VVREKPCTATAAGVPLLRLAAQTALLESEALAEMGGGDGAAARIALAVNADSMATWFTRVFSELHGVLFDTRAAWRRIRAALPRKCVAPLRQVGRFPKGLLVIAKAVPSSTRDGSMGDETYPSERGHGTLSHSSSATSAVQW